MGFIACGLIVIVGIFAGSVLESFSTTRRSEGFDSNMEVTRGLGVVATVFYILIAVLYFFPASFFSISHRK